MFTGLVQEVGSLRSVRSRGAHKILDIHCSKIRDRLSLGSSVALNGVCQTVIKLESWGFSVDTLAESLKKTSLGSYKPGRAINLEAALRLQDSLDGHLVQGHVNGLAKLKNLRHLEDNVYLELELPAKQGLEKHCVQEGSICLDGVSLTIARIQGLHLWVNLIPHTFKNTALSRLKPGDFLNVETDVLGRYIEAGQAAKSSFRKEIALWY